MNAQLQQIETELRSAQDRLRNLSRTVAPDLWTVRPDARRWSVADCVEHLNRTAEEFVPEIRAALAEASRQDARTDQRYRRDPLGWLLSIVMPPPVRLLRVKTAPSFEPAPLAEPEELIRRFEELQDEQIRCLREADGLPLNGIWIRSPFDARARYNLYSCFVILPRHQHRHLWQAEQVVDRMRPGRRR